MNAISPVMNIVMEADIFSGNGRQQQLVRKWQEQVESIGVIGSSMLQDGFVVNLGEPLCSCIEYRCEYEQTSQIRQGCSNDIAAVGTAHSTRSAGKPRTWGRSGGDEATEGTLGFLITQRVA